MDSQHTQCPHCRTVFRVTEAQLEAAGGRVRCGQCHEVFDARANLAAPPEQAVPEPAPAPFPAPEAEPAPSFDPSLDLGGLEAEPAAEADRLDATLVTPAPAEPPSAPLKGLAGPSRTGSLAWGAGSVLLLAVLVVQTTIALRAPLAESAGLRPWVKAVCGMAGCEVPLRREPDSLVLSERQVRSHPRAPSALLIEGTLENRARFPQPYPMLEVTLSSASGAVVAMRRFQPREYLAGHRDTGHGLPPRAAAPIRLEVADPGKDAVSFQFEFL
jgi:predicted Zn finger-like uncharacterized protein